MDRSRDNIEVKVKDVINQLVLGCLKTCMDKGQTCVVDRCIDTHS